MMASECRSFDIQVGRDASECHCKGAFDIVENNLCRDSVSHQASIDLEYAFVGIVEADAPLVFLPRLLSSSTCPLTTIFVR